MSKGKFVFGTLVGGLLGAVIGILLAPRSGVETREMLKDSFGNMNDCCIETKKKVEHELHDKGEVLKSKAADIGDRVKKLSEEIELKGRETVKNIGVKLAGDKIAATQNGNSSPDDN